MNLYFRILGEGQPLVVLHGLYGSSDNWMSLGREWAKHYMVILVDQRNHGRSPHNSNHSYADLASDLLELTNTLSLKKINLLGHSMGGKVAMLFAHQNPDRVNRLVVIDISPTAYSASSISLSEHEILHRNILEAMGSLNPEDFKTRQQLDDFIKVKIPNVRLRQFLLKNVSRNERGTFQWTLNINAISKNLPSIMGSVFREDQGISVIMPTLFIKGEKSNYLTQHDEKWIKKWFSNYRVISIANTGHWLHAEAPAQLTAIVNSFLG